MPYFSRQVDFTRAFYALEEEQKILEIGLKESRRAKKERQEKEKKNDKSI